MAARVLIDEWARQSTEATSRILLLNPTLGTSSPSSAHSFIYKPRRAVPHPKAGVLTLLSFGNYCTTPPPPPIGARSIHCWMEDSPSHHHERCCDTTIHPHVPRRSISSAVVTAILAGAFPPSAAIPSLISSIAHHRPSSLRSRAVP